jgi:hypothetical protein
MRFEIKDEGYIVYESLETINLNLLFNSKFYIQFPSPKRDEQISDAARSG